MIWLRILGSLGLLVALLESGELTIEIPNGCSQHGLADGKHFVRFKTDKISNMQVQIQSQDSDTSDASSASSIESNLNVLSNINNNNKLNNANDVPSGLTILDSKAYINGKSSLDLVYITEIECSQGNLFMDPSDYSVIFDPNAPPQYEIEEIHTKGGNGNGNDDLKNPRDIFDQDGNPFDSSETGQTVKCTTQYVVWLILIIMVAVFGLGLFLLLYWWCCHARNYRLIDTRIQYQYSQLPTAMQGSNINVNQIPHPNHIIETQQASIYGATANNIVPIINTNNQSDFTNIEAIQRQTQNTAIINAHAQSIP